MNDFNEIRKELCKRVSARNVQLLSGSGTLANDLVAQHLKLIPGKGLILVNGEFGERLVDHAKRVQLDFEVLYAPDGETFTQEQLDDFIENHPFISWLWFVHCETSTGVMNDLQLLKSIAKKNTIKLCIDAISSIGAYQVDLSDVYFATTVSGKAIGSFPGLSMVFYNDHIIYGKDRVPRYFDLAYYESKNGVPFTISSNAVYSLSEALKLDNWMERNEKFRLWSMELKRFMHHQGLTLVAQNDCSSHHVITIKLPEIVSSLEIGQRMESSGIFLSYKSDYLVKKNRIQICLMGECQRPSEKMIIFLTKAINEARRVTESRSNEVRSCTATEA